MKKNKLHSHKAAVVVPIHRKALTRYEGYSLQQCLRVLKAHPIVFLAPAEWQYCEQEWVTSILTHLPLGNAEKPNISVSVEYFPTESFGSVESYNRLMLSVDFYHRFINYEYILVYQLDAFVFSDQLEAWCRQGYDYIGAPWFGAEWIKEPVLRVGEFHRWKRRLLRRFVPDPVYRVGNGGFSLRKTRAMIKLLTLFQGKARQWQFNEDSFWGIFIRANYPFVRFPSVNRALEFSFEVQPRQCFDSNKSRLPFGCHAWWTYDLEFWRPWIEGYGYIFDLESKGTNSVA